LDLDSGQIGRTCQRTAEASRSSAAGLGKPWYQPVLGTDRTIAISVEDIDHYGHESHHWDWKEQRSHTLGGLESLFLPYHCHVTISVADPERTPTLSKDVDDTATVWQFSHVVHVDSEGLSDAQAHQPHQPHGELMHRMQVDGESGALRERQLAAFRR